MIKPAIVEEKLNLEVLGADKVWALKSELSIPLQHISAVEVSTEVGRNWRSHGFKLAGASVPGLITAGTFINSSKQLVFWDVHRGPKAVVIDLHNEKFAQLVVEVEDPDDFVAKLKSAAGL